jgi:hypothetical protein
MSESLSPGPLQALVAPSHAPEIYSNTLRMGATLSDFVIVFGGIKDSPTGQFGFQDLVAVRLAPRTAKTLLMNLQAAIAAYEDVLGEIKMPTSFDSDREKIRKNVAESYVQQINASSNVSTIAARHPNSAG